jgi:hypothetical protein
MSLSPENKPRITLAVPPPEDFEEEEPRVYIPVRDTVVDAGIDLLQCFVTQWKQNAGSQQEEDVWDRLAVSAAQMLSGLMSAWAAY